MSCARLLSATLRSRNETSPRHQLACAALRLARFNTNIGTVDKRFFQGLPSPAAAALVAGFVWCMEAFAYSGGELRFIAVAITVFAALTMVSNVRYYSGKDINIRRSVPFPVIVLIALGVALVFFFSDNLPELLFTVVSIYGASGYVYWAYTKLRGKPTPPPPPIAPPAT